MALGWVALAAALTVSLLRKRRLGPVWLVAVGYAVACQVPVYLMRSSAFTALELAQTLRYLPDLGVGAGFACGRGLLRTQPALCRVAGRLSPRRTAVVGVLAAASWRAVWSRRGRSPDQLAGQPDEVLSEQRGGRSGFGARGVGIADARPEVDPLILQRVVGPGEPGEPHVRPGA